METNNTFSVNLGTIKRLLNRNDLHGDSGHLQDILDGVNAIDLFRESAIESATEHGRSAIDVVNARYEWANRDVADKCDEHGVDYDVWLGAMEAADTIDEIVALVRSIGGVDDAVNGNEDGWTISPEDDGDAYYYVTWVNVDGGDNGDLPWVEVHTDGRVVTQG